MPDDPHRDALAAAIARIDALEQENRSLRDQPRTPAAPGDAARAKQTVSCAACASARIVEAKSKGRALALSVGEGLEDLYVARARVCVDCGHVSLVLADRSRIWLDTNYVRSLLVGER